MKTKTKYVRRITLFVGVLASLVLSQIAIGADYPEPGDAGVGAQVWAENCSRCHNARDPRDLRDDQWITTAFHMRVKAGLTGQQTRDVLTFLQRSNAMPVKANPDIAGRVDDSPSTMSGSDIYAQTCIACHGANGKGTVPGAPNFSRSGGVLSQSDEVLLDHVKNGFKSAGSPMAMPARGGNASLNDADIRGVIEYLKSEFIQ